MEVPADSFLLEMCRRVGRSQNRQPGEIFLPELEIVHIIKCLRRRHYDDNRKAKLKRHLLLIGPMDAAKSQIAESFLYDLCGAVDYEKTVSGDVTHPTVLQINGGTSWEKLRGGVAEGRISIPMLHDADYVYASEMFSFLGHTPSQMLQKIDQLNPAMQEGRIVVNQLKLAGVTDKEKQQFTEQLEALPGTPIHYDPQKGVISYDCQAQFIFCTRHLTPGQFGDLHPTGFLSRNVLGEWSPDQAQLKAYYDDQFGEPDVEAEAYVRAFNEYAWKAKYEKVNYPPRAMIAKVIFEINKAYWKISRETGIPFEKVRHGRTQADIAQLMTAFAVIRTLEKQRSMGVQTATVNGLVYEDLDVQRVLTFRKHFISNIEKKMQLIARSDEVLEQANGELLAFLQGRLKLHEGELGDEALATVATFRQSDLVNFICSTRKVSRPTAHNHIGKLKEAGLLHTTEQEAGKSPNLHPSGTILETLGFLSEEEKAAKLEAELNEMKTAGVYELEEHEVEEFEGLTTTTNEPKKV